MSIRGRGFCQLHLELDVTNVRRCCLDSVQILYALLCDKQVTDRNRAEVARSSSTASHLTKRVFYRSAIMILPVIMLLAYIYPSFRRYLLGLNVETIGTLSALCSSSCLGAQRGSGLEAWTSPLNFEFQYAPTIDPTTQTCPVPTFAPSYSFHNGFE